jgi:hypothetical protein
MNDVKSIQAGVYFAVSKKPKERAIPVRLAQMEVDELDEIANRYGLSRSELLRRAARLIVVEYHESNNNLGEIFEKTRPDRVVTDLVAEDSDEYSARRKPGE